MKFSAIRFSRLRFFLILALFSGIAAAQVQPVLPAYNFYGNNTPSPALPTAFLTEKYYVQTPVTTATLTAAGNAACAGGGGIVMIPAGVFQAVSLGGTISGPFPICTTAAVFWSGTAYAAGGSGTFVYGTTFVLDGTFGLYQYNNTCTLTTCPQLSNQAFSAGYLNGGGLLNMTISGGLDAVKVGSPYAPGCNGCVFANLNVINDADSGFQFENFWGETRFDNIKASGSVNLQMLFCASSGSNFQPGNSLATNLDAASADGIVSGAIRVCARGVGGALNNFMMDAVIDEIENHHAAQSAVTATFTAVTTVTPTAGTTLTPVTGTVPFANNTAIAFATATGGLTAGQVYYTLATSVGAATFEVSATQFGSPITLSCASYPMGICPTSTVSQAATASNSSSSFALVNNPFKSNQPVIATQNIGTCGGSPCIVAGTTYYIYGAFGSSFTLISALGSTTPVTISGCPTAPPACGAYFYSNAIYVPSYTSYPVDAEVTFNGTLTNTVLQTASTYFVVLNQQAAGSNGFVEVASYPGGTPIYVPSNAGNTISGLNIKNFGPSALQVWGYGQPGVSGSATVVESSFTRLDLEVNGGSENAAGSVAQNRDTTFTAAGYLNTGSTATWVIRHNSNTRIPCIADAQCKLDTLPGDIPVWVDGSRWTPASTNFSNNVEIGLAQVNPDNAGGFPRTCTGTAILYLSGLAYYDFGYNCYGDFIDVPNFAIGFQTHTFQSGIKLVPGQLTSNTVIDCSAPPCTIQFALVAPNVNTNGAGLFTVLTNPTPYILTFLTSGEGINGNASQTSIPIQPHSAVTIISYSDQGINWWSVNGNTQAPAYTVATLPTCSTSQNAYLTVVVTDASSPTYNGALTGGSSTIVPAFCTGTSWVSH